MATPELGEIAQVSVRKVWPDEARDFTPWLSKNLHLLGGELGMDLQLVRAEAPVGGFRLDILAKDAERGVLVAIENQLEATDHNHLGQLLTYASEYDVGAVVWIAPEFSGKHLAAIDWLNASTDEEVDFYGVAVRVIQIGDSLPVADFRLVASPRPENWPRRTRKNAVIKEIEFFDPLVERLKENGLDKDREYKGLTRIPVRYFKGFEDIPYAASFPKTNAAKIYLSINRNAETDRDVNQRIFNGLMERKDQIEREFGAELEWQGSLGRRGEAPRCAIFFQIGGSIDDAPEKLDGTRDRMFDSLLKLRQVLQPRLEALVTDDPA